MIKKKICFVSLGNLYLCPYIKKYISLIDCNYDVIYWDRHGIAETDSNAKKVFPYQYNMDEDKGKFNKLIGYLKFRNFALNVIDRNSYDGIVLLQTSAGILMRSFLKKKYKDKYIVDIRDYTMEKNPIFFAAEKTLINNSAYTVISSKGYEKFLPTYNYVLVHNDFIIDKDMLNKFENKKRNKDKIVISYIGLIRFHEHNKKVIMRFKNDNRFILRFIGKDALALKEFCEKNNVKNIELIDRFPPEKTLDYYYETDIIYNLYGNNTPLLDYALSNKLYYAAKLKMPILVCPNTHMELIGNKYNISFTFDFNVSQVCDDLYNYYQNINWHEFSRSCNKFIRKVNEDNEIFNKTVRKFTEQI